nr:MAG TPA: hypothetical protein [Microviridae sp.]
MGNIKSKCGGLALLYLKACTFHLTPKTPQRCRVTIDGQ